MKIIPDSVLSFVANGISPRRTAGPKIGPRFRTKSKDGRNFAGGFPLLGQVLNVATCIRSLLCDQKQKVHHANWQGHRRTEKAEMLAGKFGPWKRSISAWRT